MDMRAKVQEIAGMPSVRAGVVAFVRHFVDGIEDALNRNDWQKARDLAAEADTHADAIGAAVEHNTPAVGDRRAGASEPREMTREEAMARYGLVERTE